MNRTKPQAVAAETYIQALINKDSTIVYDIYQRFFPKTLQYVTQNQGTEEQAKDVFQESLLHIIVGSQKKRLTIQNFEAYLFTVCKNMWRREAESQKKRVIYSEFPTLIDKDTDMALFALEQERQEIYRDQFQLLSTNCQEILALFFNNTSYEAIVEELSYASINTARQRIFKCRNKLVSLIKKAIHHY